MSTINTILIANRGEIASRVIQTSDSLGSRESCSSFTAGPPSLFSPSTSWTALKSSSSIRDGCSAIANVAHVCAQTCAY